MSDSLQGADLRLAIEGGEPVRRQLLAYARPQIEEDDIQAVSDVLRSGWLTTGPRVPELESAFARQVGVREAVAVSSGTAALHAAMHALGIGPGDEVIVPALTFAATANCVVYAGARPVFADVDPDTLLISVDTASACLSPRTKAIVAVDYAGQPCDYDELRCLADDHRLALAADACHSLGAAYRGRQVGSLADLSAFSLHAVKHVAAGEGGVIATDNSDWAAAMRRFRNHGIDADHRQRQAQASWFYQQVELGYNYRLTDLQAALAHSQLAKLPRWLERRREIARRYDEALHDCRAARPLLRAPQRSHAFHLYVIRLDLGALCAGRGEIFRALRAEGIGVNVHYVPVHLHPYYRQQLGTAPGDCPQAERVYEELLSLPMFPAMTDADVDDVIAALHKVLTAFAGPRPQGVAATTAR